MGVIRKSLFERMRFPEGWWYEDMITRLVLMRLANRISLLGNVVYHKCIHKSNASNVLWGKNNVKSVDQYYLAFQLVQYSFTQLNLPNDNVVYRQIIVEYGNMLYMRTIDLPLSIRKSVFSMASSFVKKLYSEDYYLS